MEHDEDAQVRQSQRREILALLREAAADAVAPAVDLDRCRGAAGAAMAPRPPILHPGAEGRYVVCGRRRLADGEHLLDLRGNNA